MAAHSALGWAAARCAERGLAVYRLAAGAKVPLKDTHGFRDATTDAQTVAAWWRANPSANVGIRTGRASGLWILDADHQHGGDRSLALLITTHGELPATATASTPSGGRHLYFRLSADDPEIRCSQSRIGPGIDVIGEGGGIIAPPSRLRNGGRYRWIACQPPAVAPPWLVTLALPPPAAPRTVPPARLSATAGDEATRRTAYVAAAIAAELRALESAVAGTRNASLNRAAFSVGSFVAAGVVTEGWAIDMLADRALAIGLTPIETARTIRSAFAAARPRELVR